MVSDDLAASLLEEGARRALAAAKREADRRVTFRSGIPCPDGIRGCTVFHYEEVERPRSSFEIASAIALLDPAEIIKGEVG